MSVIKDIALQNKDINCNKTPMIKKEPQNVDAEDIENQEEQSLEDELNKLDAIQNEVSSMFNVDKYKDLRIKNLYPPTVEADRRSVYVGNLDAFVTSVDVEKVFKLCGEITRLTMATDKYSGQFKGHAFIEFADKISCLKACKLNGLTYKGKRMVVTPKRTNVPASKPARSHVHNMGMYAWHKDRPQAPASYKSGPSYSKQNPTNYKPY